MICNKMHSKLSWCGPQFLKEFPERDPGMVALDAEDCFNQAINLRSGFQMGTLCDLMGVGIRSLYLSSQYQFQ